MYKLNNIEKELEILLANETHKIVWDGKCFLLKEKCIRKNKEGNEDIVYETKFYYSNLGSLISKLTMMKLLTNKESISLSELVNKIYKYKKEVVDKLEETIGKSIISKDVDFDDV